MFLVLLCAYKCMKCKTQQRRKVENFKKLIYFCTNPLLLPLKSTNYYHWKAEGVESALEK